MFKFFASLKKLWDFVLENSHRISDYEVVETELIRQSRQLGIPIKILVTTPILPVYFQVGNRVYSVEYLNQIHIILNNAKAQSRP